MVHRTYHRYSNDEDSPKLKSPMPWIGIYVAAASLAVCSAMAIDTFNGFRSKKLWFPSKISALNAASLTFLAIAMKMPLDLSTSMPTSTDQLAKLSSTALMSILMSKFMPSLGPMDDTELFTNITALGVLVITVIGNVCIELDTGLIRLLIVEHALLMFLMLVCFLILSSSALIVPSTKKYLALKYSEKQGKPKKPGKFTVDELTENVRKHWMMAVTANPQFVMARAVTCSASEAICFLVALILVEAELRLFLWFPSFGFIGDSDYKWSTIFILVIQTVSVGVGTIAAVVKWYAIKFQHPKKTGKGRNSLFKTENYWIEKLQERKKSHLDLRNRGPKVTKLVQGTKNTGLCICMKFQIVIVLLCKLVWQFFFFFISQFFSCCQCCKKRSPISTSDASNNPTGTKLKPSTTCASNNPTDTKSKPSTSDASNNPTGTKFKPSTSDASNNPKGTKLKPSTSGASNKPTGTESKPSTSGASNNPTRNTSKPSTSGASNNPTGPESKPNRKTYSSQDAIYLEAEEEIPERILNNIYDALDGFINIGSKKKPKYLMELLQEYTNRKGLLGFDSKDMPSRNSQEPRDCWAMTVVTLTSIAIAISRDRGDSNTLIRRVREGLIYVNRVEKSMDSKGEVMNIRNAAYRVWADVELCRSWLNEDLTEIVKETASPKEALEKLAEVAANKVREFKSAKNGGPNQEDPLNWSDELIAANSMYRISKTIQPGNDGSHGRPDESLFKKLSALIARILSACFTNLPDVITTECFSIPIEKRDRSVQDAAQLLGETKEILKILEQHGFQYPNPDRRAYIDEWYTTIKRKSPLVFSPPK